MTQREPGPDEDARADDGPDAQSDGRSPRTSSLIRGVPWVLAANLFSTAAIGVLTLILPAVLGRYGNGIWQLYQLYAVYLAYMTLGYTDGLYLRIGGKTFGQLAGPKLGGSLALYSAIEGTVFLSAALAAGALAGPEHRGPLVWALIGCAAFVPRTAFSMVFQAVGAVRQFSATITIERFVMLAGVLILLAAGVRDPLMLILCDVVGKWVGLLLAFWLLRPHLSLRKVPWAEVRSQFVADCRDGLFVLIGNLAAILIPGFVRFIVEHHWGIEMLGDVSVGLQLTSLFMVLINSVSIAMFPNIRRLSSEQLAPAFVRLQRVIALPAFLALLAYPPLSLLLAPLFENAPAALPSLAVVIPMCLFEAKSRGLAAVFLKTVRSERALMVINIAALAAAVAVATIGAYRLDSIFVTLVAVVVGTGLRSVLSDYWIGRRLGVNVLGPSAVDVAFAAGFLVIVWLDFPLWGLAALYVTVIGYCALEWLRYRRSQRSEA